MMPQTNEDLKNQIEQLTREKERLEAEKAKLEAEKALIEARKALEQATSPATELSKLQQEKALADARKALADANKALEAPPPATELTKLQNEKALADAQKALGDSLKALEQTRSQSTREVADLQSQKSLADAQKALAEAQTQAAVARYFGDVKAGPYSGSVDMKEKAGTEEALLLAARAVNECAGKVAKAVRGLTETFYVFAAKELPTFQRLLTFRFRKELIERAFEAAGVARRAAVTDEAVTPESVAAPALVSAGLEAASKLLGFFKTDYTVGNVEAKIDESLLLFAVAGALAGEDKSVRLPSIYDPGALDPTVGALLGELSRLITLRDIAEGEADQLKTQIAVMEKTAADPKNAATKEALLASAARLKLRAEQLNGVITLYDSFAGSLTTPDAAGNVPLTAVAKEYAIDAALKGDGAVLLLRLENSGGGYLLKKNLWTGLGAMPLYHMGGATVTYLLLKGSDGAVLSGGVVPVYGGFVKTSDLRTTLR